ERHVRSTSVAGRRNPKCWGVHRVVDELGGRMCRCVTKEPPISVITSEDQPSKHVGSHTPIATRAFRLMAFYLRRQSDAGGDQVSAHAQQPQDASHRSDPVGCGLDVGCAQGVGAITAGIHWPSDYGDATSL